MKATKKLYMVLRESYLIIEVTTYLLTICCDVHSKVLCTYLTKDIHIVMQCNRLLSCSIQSP